MAGLEDILQAVSEATQGNASLIAGKRNDQAELQRGQATGMEDLIPTKVAITEAVQRAAMNAQDAGITARNSLQNNPGDPDSLMAILTQDFVANTKAARDQREAVTAKKQVGLFDNPLEFLWNQITLPDEINAMKATQSKADMAKQGIAEMQAMTTASAQAQMATQKLLTGETIAANARVQQQELANQVSKINIDALGSDIEGVKALEHSNAFQVESRIKLLSAQNMIQHQVMAERADSREQGRFDIANKNYAEDEAAQDVLAKKASIGAAQSKLKDLTYEEIKYQIRNKSMSPAKLQELVRRGEIYLEQQNAGLKPSPALAETPGRAIISRSITGGFDTPEYKGITDFLEGVQNEAGKEYITTHPNAKDSPETRKAIAAAVDDKLFGARDKSGKPTFERGLIWKQLQSVETEGNIYRAPALDTLVDIPGVKTNVLYEKVIAPAVASGVKSSDVQTVLAQAYAARARGEVTTEQIALGVSQLYTAANTAKYTSSMSKFSMPYYDSYNVKVPSAYGWGSEMKDVINFAKPDEVLDYLTLLERKKRIQDYLGVQPK